MVKTDCRQANILPRSRKLFRRLDLPTGAIIGGVAGGCSLLILSSAVYAYFVVTTCMVGPGGPRFSWEAIGAQGPMGPYGPYGPIYSHMSRVRFPIYSHMSRVIPSLLSTLCRLLGIYIYTRRGSKIFLFISQNTFLGRIGSIWEMGGCSARQNKVHIDARLFGFKEKLGFRSTEALGLLMFCFFRFLKH